MIVGIPKEIKNYENRVSLTPAGAHELVQRGHTVYIQHTAGINSGFSDEEYEKVGARINPEKPDVPLNKNDAFQKVQKRRVQEKR